MSEVVEKLKVLLGREPSCSQLKDGTFMADYFEYGAPAKKFIAATEEKAYEALLTYLEKKPSQAAQ